MFIGIRGVFLWPLKSHSVKYAGAGHYAILDNSGLDMYDKKLYTTKNSVASVFYLANSHIYRFDEKGKLLYHAIQHKNSNGGTYLFQPFEFYAPNNWPMPQEKPKKRWF